MGRNFDIRPGEQILYIGSYACTRHRANELAELQQKEQLAYLCLDEVDFITGDYIQKMMEAVRKVAKERNALSMLLHPGCQCALLSTDFTMIAQELTEALGIPVRVHDSCRLCDDSKKRRGYIQEHSGERLDRDRNEHHKRDHRGMAVGQHHNQYKLYEERSGEE
ncbi:hypothetical protein [Hungatella hathewayi]